MYPNFSERKYGFMFWGYILLVMELDFVPPVQVSSRKKYLDYVVFCINVQKFVFLVEIISIFWRRKYKSWIHKFKMIPVFMITVKNVLRCIDEAKSVFHMVESLLDINVLEMLWHCKEEKYHSLRLASVKYQFVIFNGISRTSFISDVESYW